MKNNNCGNDRFEVYGTTIAGERGQVVIPQKAREEFNIKKGDTFLVFSAGHHKKQALMLVPLNKVGDFVNQFKDIVADLEKQVKKIKK